MELAFDYDYNPGATPTQNVLVVASNIINVNVLPPLFRQGSWGLVRLAPDVPEGTIGGGEIRGGLEDFSRVSDYQFDAIYSPQNLKGLPAHAVVPALREMHRCLKEGGFVLVSVPDLMRIAEMIGQHRLEEPAYETKLGPITPLDMLFGPSVLIAQGRRDMEHRTGFTAYTLGRKLKEAGFYNIQVYRKDMELMAHGFKITDPDAPRQDKIAIHDPELKDRGKLPDELDQPPQKIDESKRT